MKPKSHSLLIVLGLAAILATALIVLLQLSFTPGNIYPPYSTLRTDPLGASALLESLQALPGRQAARNYQPLPKLIPHAGATFVELGSDFDNLVMQSPRNYAFLEELLAAGSRLIFLSNPVTENLPANGKSGPRKTETKTSEKQEDPKAPPKEEKENAGLLFSHDISLCDKWGFSMEPLPQAEKSESNPDGKPVEKEALPTADSGFQKPLHWASHLVFRNLDPAWKVLYEKEGHPVLIERSQGKGSIVLGSDAYFMSNEALQSDRRTDLILRVLGPGKNIYFSETQHGLHEQTGLPDLFRRYHLQGTFACMVLLAILFVWRSTCSLVPPFESGKIDETHASGLTAREGMIHLLQRNLTPIQVFQEGLNRWIKFCGKSSPGESRLRARDYLFEIRSGKKLNERTVGDVYKNLQSIMTERK